MCSTSKNVGYVFLPHGVKEEVFEEETSSGVFNTLKKSAKNLRKALKGIEMQFSGSLNESSDEKIPIELKMFLALFLENSVDTFSTHVNTLAQLLIFNLRSDRSLPGTKHHHSSKREPAIPLYIGWKIYSKTKSVDLVSHFNQLGLCPTYKRLDEINNQIAASMIQVFEEDKAVTSSKHLLNLFTTSALDNMDHNPSSTTAQYDFHGSALSITQHPDENNIGS